MKTTRRSGFTLVEIMIVVAIIGLLAAIAIPNFVKARTTAQKNVCITNLKQIDGAVQQRALENKKTGTSLVSTKDILDYLKGSVLPARPANGTYDTATVSTTPKCTLVASGQTL